MTSYHLYSHNLHPLLRMVLFVDQYLKEDDMFSNLFFKEKLDGVSIAESIKISSLIRTFYENYFDGVVCSTQHILDACSPELANVLSTFEWFDEKERIFCDIPLPNLITDLLLGLYGFPYHANTKKIKRFAYRAKETMMFTDVIVFDQARYIYDLLPTLPLFKTNFDISQQLILRICMDSLHRHCHYGNKDLFWGCALASMGEQGHTFWVPEARESIGNIGVIFNEPNADGYEV